MTILDKDFPQIEYWRGTPQSKYEDKPTSERRGPHRCLFRLEEVVITLAKPALIGCLATCSMSVLLWCRASSHNWIVVLAAATSPLRQWPDKELIRTHMPRNVKQDYPKTTVIIDCAEFFIQRPENPTAQSQTYSSYKSHNTVKCLFGVSPTGAFIYVSELFTGNTSDKHIVAHSDFLDYIQHGDDVMADRGFLIRNLLLDRGATLNMPPFTRKCNSGKGKRLSRERKSPDSVHTPRSCFVSSLSIYTARATGS
jgi:hypothetical protein